MKNHLLFLILLCAFGGFTTCQNKGKDPSPTHDTLYKVITEYDTVVLIDTLLIPDTSRGHDTLVDVQPILGRATLGGPASPLNHFYSPLTGQTYSLADSAHFDENQVDIVAEFDEGYLEFTSCGHLPFIYPHPSYFLKDVRWTGFELTDLNLRYFEAADNAYIQNLRATGQCCLGFSQAYPWNVGKVYAFRNFEGRHGLLYIEAINYLQGNNGEITIRTKLER